jgi:hypothetical protein
MIKLKIKKEELDLYLTPFSINEIIIFSHKFLDKDGFFGIKNNTLIFISMEKIESELSIEYPADISEVQAFLTTADYLVQRVLMSEHIKVIGLEDISEEESRKEILKILYKFIKNFKHNNIMLDQIKDDY